MKLFRILYYAFFGLIGFIALALVVSTFPITRNYKFYIVQSGSMEPSIPMGSIVMVKPALAYRIGEVITFRNPADPRASITHRVADIRVDQGTPIYLTKGDANNAPDAREVSPSDVLGKVLFHVPYLGYGVAVAKTAYGFTILILIPAAILIVDEGEKIWREIKRMREKKEMTA